MRIAGLHKCSFVDYPGRLAAVAFTPGCNLDCFYCHNRGLLGGDSHCRYDAGEVLDLLAGRRGLLDGLVVTGGEPTLQVGLEGFLQRARALGYAIKLDTNGTRPAVLRRLIDRDLVDFVAMDIKAPLDRYEEICRVAVDTESIRRSIGIVLAGATDYEFRTTFAPPLATDDVVRIAMQIRGARSYVLQQYRPPDGIAGLPQPRPDRYVRATARMLRPFVRHCSVRGLRPAPARGGAPAGMPSRPAATPVAVAARPTAMA